MAEANRDPAPWCRSSATASRKARRRPRRAERTGRGGGHGGLLLPLGASNNPLRMGRAPLLLLLGVAEHLLRPRAISPKRWMGEREDERPGTRTKTRTRTRTRYRKKTRKPRHPSRTRPLPLRLVPLPGKEEAGPNLARCLRNFSRRLLCNPTLIVCQFRSSSPCSRVSKPRLPCRSHRSSRGQSP